MQHLHLRLLTYVPCCLCLGVFPPLSLSSLQEATQPGKWNR